MIMVIKKFSHDNDRDGDGGEMTMVIKEVMMT